MFTSFRAIPWLWSTFAVGCLSAAAQAQQAPVPFTENFDGSNAVYALGSVINGQGGWKQWAAATNTTSVVVDGTTGFARSGQAVAVDSVGAAGSPTSDLVHEFIGANAGKKTMAGWTYAPTGTIDKWYFLLMSDYADNYTPTQFKWAAQMIFDPSAGVWSADNGAPVPVQGALILDAWVEIRAEIDFANDLVTLFYNGTPVGPAYPWSKGTFGTGVADPLNLAAIDLYHNPATALPSGRAYWDDITLLDGFPPPPPTVYCVAKTNSLGCTPVISGTGQSSATLTSGFVVKSVNMRNNKVGLLFYTAGGQASTPFTGGTLCVGGELKRVQGLNTGGTPAPVNDCTGIFSVDMNSFRAGLLGGNPNAFLSVVGTVVDSQFWGRDPGFPAPNNTQLSDGLEFTVGN